MKILFVLATGLLFTLSASSQLINPIKWSYAAKRTSATSATIFIKATMEEGWHIYSQKATEGGPVKTTFTFAPGQMFQLEGHVAEPTPVTKFEKAFDMNVSYFEKEVIFQQKVKLNSGKTTIKGAVEYMVCSDRQCLPPQTAEFSIPVN